MIELTQAEFEALEVKVGNMRKQFLEELAKHAELSRMYSELLELEGMAVDSRRARREAEVHES